MKKEAEVKIDLSKHRYVQGVQDGDEIYNLYLCQYWDCGWCYHPNVQVPNGCPGFYNCRMVEVVQIKEGVKAVLMKY